MRLSGLRTGEGEMESALSALQGKEAKDPSQGMKAQRQGEPLWEEGTTKERGRIHEAV